MRNQYYPALGRTTELDLRTAVQINECSYNSIQEGDPVENELESQITREAETPKGGWRHICMTQLRGR